MQVVAAIVLGGEPIGMVRITRQFVEVEHSVEMAWRSDPCINRLPVSFRFGTGMVERRAYERHDGRTEHLNTMRVSAPDHLFVCADDSMYLFLVLRGRHIAVLC